MSKAQRFPRKVEFWTTDAQADAFDRLELQGMLGKPDHWRQAGEFYLRQLGIAPQPRSNGHAQPTTA